LSLHQWGAVTLFHGLPSDRVRAIAQDKDGLMWFGTDAGLAKYDGRRSQTITSEGLPQGRVLALKIDDEGVLWVGTEGGATRLVSNQFLPIKETEGKVITAIITPERGRAFLASDDGVIFAAAVDGDDGLVVRTIPSEPLNSADVDKPGRLQITSLVMLGKTLYAGTRSRGVLAIDGDSVKEVQSRPRPVFVEALEIDPEGDVWIGAKLKTEDGALYEARDLARPEIIAAATAPVCALRADRQNNVWVGTDGGGVFQYRGEERVARFTFAQTGGGLRSDHVYSIFVDREDVVWFGTDRGVCRYDPYALRVETISANPESNFVRTLLKTAYGRLWVGTNRGLFVRENPADPWHSVAEVAEKTVYSITTDDQGRLLVGSASGLYVSDKSANEPGTALRFVRRDPSNSNANAGDSVRAIVKFRNQTYVATFGRGIERLDDKGRTLVWPTDPQDARSREVLSLYADGNTRLWIGTATSGVYGFDGANVRSDPALAELTGSAVWSMDGTNDGWLWIATSRGLYGYSQGTLSHVLPDVDARRVMVSSDGASSKQVWCATAGNGLVKVALDPRFGPMSTRLDAEQGLPSQSAFALLQSAGPDAALLIGTNRGLARYNPGRILPILTITRLIGQRIHTLDELSRGLNLEYPQNSLVLDVSATSSRTFPEQFQYAFLLFDSNGNLVKRKLARDAQLSMEDLRPGKYRVEVRAYSADLVPSSPLAFEFTVAKAPFPWTTAALSALLLLAVVALIWAIIEHRRIAHASAALALANHELADARLRLANEAETERRRIARDLHDQTLADLRRLLLLTDKLPAEEKGNGKPEFFDPALFRQEIESVSTEIRRICEDLSPSVLENVGLSAALEWALADAVAHMPESCKFEYDFKCEEDLDERIAVAPGVRMQIYRITQEAVSNICRHSGAGRVGLTVTLIDGDLTLTLVDDGSGFDPRDKKAGLGRGVANIRARASLIEADVSWKRNPSGGTIFTLQKADVMSLVDQPV
jgi:ligand-binding sensor domain-containing protein/two-component sensor histidine kinase